MWITLLSPFNYPCNSGKHGLDQRVQNCSFVEAERENLVGSRISVSKIVHLSLSGMFQKTDTLFLQYLPSYQVVHAFLRRKITGYLVTNLLPDVTLPSASVFREFY
jgi:hypothetical protein